MQARRYRGFVMGLLFWATIGVCSSPAKAASEVTECDVLVSHPSDPDRVTEGVSSAAVDHELGIAACKTAVANDSANPRLNYLLARVLFYDEKADAAIPYLEKAAAGDYRQAQFVLGYILADGRGGVEADICRVEMLWSESARNGRLAALISYPHHFVRGRFDACEMHVPPSEMEDFLTQAEERQLDYYQRVLVGDVRADLREWLEDQ